jgi:hypothetical protein
MLCCIVYKKNYASLYVCDGFGCAPILVCTNELYFGLDVMCHLFYLFVKSDSCRCQHGSAQHPSIMSIKYFYSELHITLECKDTKLWPIFGCIAMFLLMLGGF